MARAMARAITEAVLVAYVTRRARRENLRLNVLNSHGCFPVINSHGCFPCDQIARAMTRAIWSSGRRWGASCVRCHTTSATGRDVRRTSRAIPKPYEHEGRGHTTNLYWICFYFYSVVNPKAWVLVEYARPPKSRMLIEHARFPKTLVPLESLGPQKAGC